MNRIRTSSPLVFLSLVSLVMAFASFASAADKIKLKVCTVAPPGTPWEQQTKGIKKHIRKDSGGVIKMKVYWGGAKGGEQECLKKVIKSDLHMYGGTLSAMNFHIPEFEVFDLPFLWDSTEQVDYVLDNHATPLVREIMAKGDLVFYQWAENGWQSVGNSGKFTKSPADFAGIPIRVQPSVIHPLTWKVIGATPVPLDIPDVVDALRTKKVTAFGQTPLYTFAANWQPHITHYTLTQHVYQPATIIYSKKFFDTLTPDLQKACLAHAQKDAEEGRAGVRQLEGQLIENFKSYGIKVYALTKAERKVFQKKGKEVRKQFESQASPSAKQLLKVIDKGQAAFNKK
ncbi:MAG: TRAP transporter substrate-binding protein DctP [Deltaproteobacteria bacterium]|jgi:TRAP-type transport system periplasmic protein|nr:TRAP transporter substrate-binding protein DctP [Deltaproteobacteria bacterium]MBT6433015.1 TRAP transporter substrate-binding protein DctP [Deltaproteobacteria bacterium]MBT6490739.1 TRAP transporter substrate-binding protein DctP [Deltaproteobacteria bacterium]